MILNSISYKKYYCLYYREYNGSFIGDIHIEGDIVLFGPHQTKINTITCNFTELEERFHKWVDDITKSGLFNDLADLFGDDR